ncbi:MAG: nitroreductase/quinone reductase family protein [Gammaproteobacteria bacterium]|nr:nitroreductase/quinone reductase family protein [Gammaproteobacteria bacterium]
MKTVKIIAILCLVYVGIVAAFESLLGYFQPEGQSTLVITTTDEDGIANDRVVARLESNGQLYVAANHWPRAWYNHALENPNVQVTFDGEKGTYLAVPVTDEEHERVNSEHSLGIVFRILTGFPPRYFVRLDPR